MATDLHERWCPRKSGAPGCACPLSKKEWELMVCPECGSAVSRAFTPPEFYANCRHPIGPKGCDRGRNVKRVKVMVE